MADPARTPPADLHRRLPVRLQRLDLDLYRRVAGAHAPLLDATLPRLTRAADHGALWFGVAAGLAAVGGRRPSRAAARGLASLTLASTLANGPIKAAFRRRRPLIDVVPAIRRVRRQPTTHSFPSGHTASAFAFATGAALEFPALTAPLGALAAAVGASRVYTGVHYPADVVAGAALGVGAALATTRVVARGHGRTAALPAERTSRPAPALPGGRGLALLTNPAAGTATDVTARLRHLLPEARFVEVHDPARLSRRAWEAATGAEALGVIGGDGSINCVAAVARSLGVPLVVVPGGTHNHLAADLGLRSLEDVAVAVEAGTVTALDLVDVDGEAALNGIAMGPYPEYVRARTAHEPRVGRRRAVARAALAALRGTDPLVLEIDGEIRETWGLYVGVGTYGPQRGWPTRRVHVGDGLLDVRLVRADVPLARTRATLATLGPTPLTRGAVEGWRATRLRVRHLGGGPIAAGVDGEHATLAPDVTFELRAAALEVYAPAATEPPPSVSAPQREMVASSSSAAV